MLVSYLWFFHSKNSVISFWLWQVRKWKQNSDNLRRWSNIRLAILRIFCMQVYGIYSVRCVQLDTVDQMMIKNVLMRMWIIRMRQEGPTRKKAPLARKILSTQQHLTYMASVDSWIIGFMLFFPALIFCFLVFIDFRFPLFFSWIYGLDPCVGSSQLIWFNFASFVFSPSPLSLFNRCHVRLMLLRREDFSS